MASRDDRWSESIAVGSLDFVEKIKTELGTKAMHRDFEPAGEAYALRKPAEAYGRNFGGKTELLRPENTISWNENAEGGHVTRPVWRERGFLKSFY